MILIDGYEIDAAISEKHSHTAEVTDHVMEDGTFASDHVILHPRVYTVEGVVSDTPIGRMIAERIRQGTFSAEGDLPAVLPSDDALARLEALWESRRPVSVVTTRKTYKNMILQLLDVSDGPQTGDALSFVAEFKQVEFATVALELVRVPRGKVKAKLGNKSAEALTGTSATGAVTKVPSKTERARSVLESFYSGRRVNQFFGIGGE